MNPHVLEGKKGLVVGIANDRSIAYGCAREFIHQGANLAVTYLNEKAEPYVRPLAEALQAPIILPCDVTHEGQLEAVFETIGREWGRLDFLLHAIAYASKDDLYGRVIDSSEAGFNQAMAISCHSFLRMAHLAEPLMKEGGSLLTLTFYGSEKVVEGYGIMGPVKAALECCVKYAAAELSPKGIRVNALSPGPIHTRAASGIPGFDNLMKRVVDRSFHGQSVTIEEVGKTAAHMVSDASCSTTGSIYYIDGGYHNSAC